MTETDIKERLDDLLKKLEHQNQELEQMVNELANERKRVMKEVIAE